MILRKRSGDRGTLMSVGMLALLLASLSHWYLHPATPLGRRMADGSFGLLVGLSIGFNLLSLRRGRGSRNAE